MSIYDQMRRPKRVEDMDSPWPEDFRSMLQNASVNQDRFEGLEGFEGWPDHFTGMFGGGGVEQEAAAFPNYPSAWMGKSTEEATEEAAPAAAATAAAPAAAAAAPAEAAAAEATVVDAAEASGVETETKEPATAVQVGEYMPFASTEERHQPYIEMINRLTAEAIEEYGIQIDPRWVAAVIERESTFNPGLTGSSGEYGLMQIMPLTAGDLGIQDLETLWDPETNIRAGIRYLVDNLRVTEGDPEKALGGYNAGITTLRNWRDLGYQSGWLDEQTGINKTETTYMPIVWEIYQNFIGSGG